MPGVTNNFLVTESGTTSVLSQYLAAGSSPTGTGGHLQGIFLAGLTGHAQDVDVNGAALVRLGSFATSGLAYNQVAPGVTATIIAAARAARDRLIIQNHHPSVDTWIGDASVTVNNGFKLPFGGSSITLLTTVAVYAIVAAGTGAVCFIEEF